MFNGSRGTLGKPRARNTLGGVHVSVEAPGRNARNRIALGVKALSRGALEGDTLGRCAPGNGMRRGAQNGCALGGCAVDGSTFGARSHTTLEGGGAIGARALVDTSSRGTLGGGGGITLTLGGGGGIAHGGDTDGGTLSHGTLVAL